METNALNKDNAGILYLGKSIQLINLKEYESGFPLIGSLLINGKNVFRRLNFSEHYIFHNDILYIPMAREMDEKIRFSACAINLKTFEMNVSKEKFDVMILNRIQGNWLIFYADQKQEISKNISLMWVF